VAKSPEVLTALVAQLQKDKAMVRKPVLTIIKIVYQVRSLRWSLKSLALRRRACLRATCHWDALCLLVSYSRHIVALAGFESIGTDADVCGTCPLRQAADEKWHMIRGFALLNMVRRLANDNSQVRRLRTCHAVHSSVTSPNLTPWE
jgi:hypothetical protein